MKMCRNKGKTNTEQHAVDPVGQRRFSLTSRYIDPKKMKSAADREDAAIKGAMPPNSDIYMYGATQIQEEVLSALARKAAKNGDTKKADTD